MFVQSYTEFLTLRLLFIFMFYFYCVFFYQVIFYYSDTQFLALLLTPSTSIITEREKYSFSSVIHFLNRQFSKEAFFTFWDETLNAFLVHFGTSSVVDFRETSLICSLNQR